MSSRSRSLIALVAILTLGLSSISFAEFHGLAQQIASRRAAQILVRAQTSQTTEEQKQTWQKESNAVREKLKAGEVWSFKGCKEAQPKIEGGVVIGSNLIADLASQKNRVRVLLKTIDGEKRAIYGSGETDGDNLVFMGQQIPPFSFSSEKTSSKNIWTGTGKRYQGEIAPSSIPVKYEEGEMDRKIITAFLSYSPGRRYCAFFPKEVASTCYTIHQFDNQGNAVTYRTEVTADGRQKVGIQFACGNAFGHAIDQTTTTIRTVDDFTNDERLRSLLRTARHI